MRFLPQYSYVVDINAVAAVVAVEDIAVNVLGLGVANDTDNSFVVAVLAFQDIFAREKRVMLIFGYQEFLGILCDWFCRSLVRRSSWRFVTFCISYLV